MSKFAEGKLRDVIANIAIENDFSKNMQIIFPKPTGKTDGFMAEIVRINVVDEATNKSIHFVVKISMKGEIIREVVPVVEAYYNEIRAYAKIFPALRKFQIEAKIPNIFNAIPKFYAASSAINEEYIIMEDLSKSGYEMLEMRQLLNYEHTEFIMRKYGELHALSFALKILHPVQFQEFQERKKAWTILFTEKRIGEQFPKIWKFIRSTMKERGFENNRIDYYTEKCLSKLDKMTKHENENICCFLHGDCWSNNLMFKYKISKLLPRLLRNLIQDGHKIVEDMKMLDWQYCNVGPPVHDLSYSLYSGGTKEIWMNLENFLRIYHEIFSKFLAQFDIDANAVFSFEGLKKQWRKYYHFGAILAGPIWKFRSFEDDQGVDPLNYSADDDSIYLDALSGAECNREYLFDNIRNLCEDTIDESRI